MSLLRKKSRSSLVTTVARIESVFLTPTAYSPLVDSLGREDQVVELRRYRAADGKAAALHTRFANHSVALFAEHGLTNVAYFSIEQPPGQQHVEEVLFLLAHPTIAAAGPAYDRLHADPRDIAFKEQEKLLHPNGVIALGGVSSEFLRPTDYSAQLPPVEGGVLSHLVCFKFRPGTSQKAISDLIQAFQSLPTEIPSVRTFEWGINNSPEGKDHGFTHCFLLSFDSAAARNAYLPHPSHVHFGETFVRPVVDDVFVIDWWGHDHRYVVTPPSHSRLQQEVRRVVRHIVCYQFSASTLELQRNARAGGFHELTEQIASIEAFEWGVNTSSEGKTKGFTHCFMLQFGSEADRDGYLPHPAHLAYQRKFKAIPATDVLVIDFCPLHQRR